MAHEHSSSALVEHVFQSIDDPRVERTKRHSLITVLVIGLTGTLCGVQGWDALVEFGRGKLDWLRSFLDVKNGIPSADTLRRVFAALNPKAFEQCFMAWVQALTSVLPGEVVAVDGKSIKGAVDAANRTVPLHMVHVWATKQRALLGVVAVEGAPGESRATHDLLRLLELRGSIVTGDANLCTSSVARATIERGADYVLCLKGNRGPLHEHVVDLLEGAARRDFAGVRHDFHESANKGHGRTETRKVWAVGHGSFPVDHERWPGLRTAVRIERTRTTADRTATEVRYYISSMKPDAAVLANAIRSHWLVENDLHWSLDALLDEDSCRIHDMTSAANVAILRRMALMILRGHPEKKSVPLKQLRACTDNDFLLALIKSGIPTN